MSRPQRSVLQGVASQPRGRVPPPLLQRFPAPISRASREAAQSRPRQGSPPEPLTVGTPAPCRNETSGTSRVQVSNFLRRNFPRWRSPMRMSNPDPEALLRPTERRRTSRRTRHRQDVTRQLRQQLGSEGDAALSSPSPPHQRSELRAWRPAARAPVARRSRVTAVLGSCAPCTAVSVAVEQPRVPTAEPLPQRRRCPTRAPEWRRRAHRRARESARDPRGADPAVTSHRPAARQDLS